MSITEQTANDLNEICEYALNIKSPFALKDYASNVKQQTSAEHFLYYEYLADRISIMGQKYDEWPLEQVKGGFEMNGYTKTFLSKGGYLSIYRKEKKDEDLTDGIIKTNKASFNNVIATVIFSVIILFIQVMSCNREIARENREKQQILRDSIQQTLQSRHDSIYEAYLLRRTIEIVDSSINNAQPKK